MRQPLKPPCPRAVLHDKKSPAVRSLLAETRAEHPLATTRERPPCSIKDPGWPKILKMRKTQVTDTKALYKLKAHPCQMENKEENCSLESLLYQRLGSGLDWLHLRTAVRDLSPHPFVR